MRVKVCGIKRIEDALKAVEFGADAIGMLVGQKHASTDLIDAGLAKLIVEILPPFCSSILVTRIVDSDEIARLARFIGVNTIQLHGENSVGDAMSIRARLPGVKLIKSLHVTDKNSIQVGRKFLDVVDAILLDTIIIETDQVGGTGITHDWNLSREIVESYDLPVILAGGLNPDNVQQAIQTVKPFAVDANSGTKGSDGFKDTDKLKAFIKNAKM